MKLFCEFLLQAEEETGEGGLSLSSDAFSYRCCSLTVRLQFDANRSYLDPGITSQVFISSYNFLFKNSFYSPKARAKGMKADLDTTKTDVIAPFLSIQKYGLRSRG